MIKINKIKLLGIDSTKSYLHELLFSYLHELLFSFRIVNINSQQ